MQGSVVRITSDVIEISFLENNSSAEIGQVVLLHEGKTVLLIESILDSKNVLAIILHLYKPIKINDIVTNTLSPIQVPVGYSTRGKVFDILSLCLNEEDDNNFDFGNNFLKIPINSTIAKKLDFHNNPELIETGIKVIDFFIPLIKGNKLGIFGGAGVGKTIIMKELIFNSSKIDKSTYSIFIGSGERSREGQELYEELQEANLLENSTMYISQMNEEPGARMNILPLGITAAEYMRDVEEKNVLLFIDNIYRFIQAGNELSASLGKKPSSAGYQPTLYSEVSSIQERLIKTSKGSITSFQTVFLPSDDITDPASVAIFSHLDASLVLDREIAASGIYPAFDPLSSSSNNIDIKLIGKKHYDALFEVKYILQKYKELEDLILILGIDDLEENNKIIIKKALQLKNFFSQRFLTAKSYTKEEGFFATKEETLDSIIAILQGDFLERNPEDFLYIKNTFNLKTDKQIQEEEQIKILLKAQEEEKINIKKVKKNRN